MKRALIVFVSLSILSGLGGAFYFQKYLKPELKTNLETRLAAALGGKAQIGNIQPIIWPSIGLRFVEVQGQNADSTTRLRVADAIFGLNLNAELFEQKISTFVIVDGVEVQTYLPTPTKLDPAAQPSEPKTLSADIPGSQIRFEIIVKNSRFKIIEPSDKGPPAPESRPNVFEITKFQLEAKGPHILEPFQIQSSGVADFSWGGYVGALPFEFSTTAHADIPNWKLTATKSHLSIAGLDIGGTGSYDLIKSLHSWTIFLKIDDLSQSSVKPHFLPPGQWSGGLFINADISRVDTAPWTGLGKIQFQNLEGVLNHQDLRYQGKGRLRINSSIDFELLEKTRFKTSLEVDLTDLDFAYRDLVKKPASVPCQFKIRGRATDQNFEIEEAQLRFHTLNALASGQLDTRTGHATQLRIRVPRIGLTGFEKFFAPLSRSPLSGFLEANLLLDGNLQDAENLRIEINPLSLERVSGFIKYTDGDLSVDGPVQIDAKMVLNSTGMGLRDATLTARSNLQQLQVFWGADFQKPKGSIFQLSLQAQKQGDHIALQSGELATAGGLVSITGTIKNPQSPTLSLKSSLAKIDLELLSRLFPKLQRYHAQGALAANINVGGTYDYAKGLPGSQLVASGAITGRLARIKTSSDTGGEFLSLEPFLPPWPAVKNSSFSYDLQISDGEIQGIPFRGLSSKGSIQKGQLIGQATLSSAFGGTINLQEIKMPVGLENPIIFAKGTFQRIQLEPYLNWALPDWKGVLAGVGTGGFWANLMPTTHPDFSKAARAQVKFDVQNGFLGTLRFEKLARERVAALPGIGTTLAPRGGGFANMKADVLFQNNALQVNYFNAMTGDFNELRATGVLQIDKNLQLNAKVFLKDPPIRLEILKRHSDGQGRLALDTIIRGNVLAPELTISDAQVQSLTKSSKGVGL